MAEPPDPAPEIVMALNGVYWRRYPGFLSMVPVSDDNDPVIGPLAVYRLVGSEDHEGDLHITDEMVERAVGYLASGPGRQGCRTPNWPTAKQVRSMLSAAFSTSQSPGSNGRDGKQAGS